MSTPPLTTQPQQEQQQEFLSTNIRILSVNDIYTTSPLPLASSNILEGCVKAVNLPSELLDPTQSPHYIKPRNQTEVPVVLPIGGLDILRTVFDNLSHGTTIDGKSIEPINTLSFLNGDILGGSLFAEHFKGESMAELLNEISPTVIGIGNHEYDYGTQQFEKLISTAQFTWLGENITINEKNNDNDGNEYNTRPHLQLPPCIIIDFVVKECDDDDENTNNTSFVKNAKVIGRYRNVILELLIANLLRGRCDIHDYTRFVKASAENFQFFKETIPFDDNDNCTNDQTNNNNNNDSTTATTTSTIKLQQKSQQNKQQQYHLYRLGIFSVCTQFTPNLSFPSPNTTFQKPEIYALLLSLLLKTIGCHSIFLISHLSLAGDMKIAELSRQFSKLVQYHAEKIGILQHNGLQKHLPLHITEQQSQSQQEQQNGDNNNKNENNNNNNQDDEIIYDEQSLHSRYTLIDTIFGGHEHEPIIMQYTEFNSSGLIIDESGGDSKGPSTTPDTNIQLDGNNNNNAIHIDEEYSDDDNEHHKLELQPPSLEYIASLRAPMNSIIQRENIQYDPYDGPVIVKAGMNNQYTAVCDFNIFIPKNACLDHQHNNNNNNDTNGVNGNNNICGYGTNCNEIQNNNNKDNDNLHNHLLYHDSEFSFSLHNDIHTTFWITKKLISTTFLSQNNLKRTTPIDFLETIFKPFESTPIFIHFLTHILTDMKNNPISNNNYSPPSPSLSTLSNNPSTTTPTPTTPQSIDTTSFVSSSLNNLPPLFPNSQTIISQSVPTSPITPAALSTTNQSTILPHDTTTTTTTTLSTTIPILQKQQSIAEQLQQHHQQHPNNSPRESMSPSITTNFTTVDDYNNIHTELLLPQYQNVIERITDPKKLQNLLQIYSNTVKETILTHSQPNITTITSGELKLDNIENNNNDEFNIEDAVISIAGTGPISIQQQHQQEQSDSIALQQSQLQHQQRELLHKQQQQSQSTQLQQQSLPSSVIVTTNKDHHFSEDLPSPNEIIINIDPTIILNQSQYISIALQDGIMPCPLPHQNDFALSPLHYLQHHSHTKIESIPITKEFLNKNDINNIENNMNIIQQQQQQQQKHQHHQPLSIFESDTILVPEQPSSPHDDNNNDDTVNLTRRRSISGTLQLINTTNNNTNNTNDKNNNNTNQHQSNNNNNSSNKTLQLKRYKNVLQSLPTKPIIHNPSYIFSKFQMYLIPNIQLPSFFPPQILSQASSTTKLDLNNKHIPPIPTNILKIHFPTDTSSHNIVTKWSQQLQKDIAQGRDLEQIICHFETSFDTRSRFGRTQGGVSGPNTLADVLEWYGLPTANAIIQYQNELYEFLYQQYPSLYNNNTLTITELLSQIDASDIPTPPSSYPIQWMDYLTDILLLPQNKIKGVISCINGGFLRGDKYYPKGSDLTLGDVLSELPFPKTALHGLIYGDDLIRAINQQLTLLPTPTGAFPHFSSNVSIVYSNTPITTTTATTSTINNSNSNNNDNISIQSNNHDNNTTSSSISSPQSPSQSILSTTTPLTTTTTLSHNDLSLFTTPLQCSDGNDKHKIGHRNYDDPTNPFYVRGTTTTTTTTTSTTNNSNSTTTTNDNNANSNNNASLAHTPYAPDVPKRVYSILIDGQPIDPNGLYFITSTQFILWGGDGLTSFLRSCLVPSIIPDKRWKVIGDLTLDYFAFLKTEANKNNDDTFILNYTPTKRVTMHRKE